MNVATDAAETRQLEETPRESETKFQLLFEKSPDAMLLLDEDVFVDCNQAAVEMMSCASKEQLLTLHPYDISPERQPDGRLSSEKAHDLIATAFREGSARFEWVHRAVDGTDFPVEVLLTAIPLRSEKVLHVAWRDITQRKRTEEALQSAYQTLELRVEERTREIERRRQVAEGLRDILKVLNSNRPLDEILDYIVGQASRLLGANAGVIYRLEVAEELIIVEATCGMPADFAAIETIPFTKTNPNQAVLNRRPFAVPDLANRLKTVYLDDAELPPGLEEWAAVVGEHFRAYLSVPLIVRDKVYGAVSLYYHEPREFSDEEIELAVAFGDQAALAIENAWLHQAEQNRQRELQTLLDVAAAVSSSLELDGMLSAALNRLVALVGASRAGVMLLDGESGELKPRMLRPERSAAPDDLTEMTRACHAVIGGGEPLYVPPDPEKGFVEPGALLPLRVRGQALGVLVIIGPQGSAFSEGHLALFESIADQLGVAIENARLYEQSEQAAVAAERSRLARDLHDAVTQTLFSASLIAEVLPRIWERYPEEGRRRLDELRELTRGALAEMRTLLLELRPSALVDAPLDDLLRQLAESITGRARVPVVVEVEGECVLPPEVKVALYRIAQEALNNVAKHAGASQALVSLRCAPPFPPEIGGEQRGGVELRISDDGRGFDPEGIPPESLGLGIMRERAEAIGATLIVGSEVGRGTEVVVEWSASNVKRQT